MERAAPDPAVDPEGIDDVLFALRANREPLEGGVESRGGWSDVIGPKTASVTRRGCASTEATSARGR